MRPNPQLGLPFVYIFNIQFLSYDSHFIFWDSITSKKPQFILAVIDLEFQAKRLRYMNLNQLQSLSKTYRVWQWELRNSKN